MLLEKYGIVLRSLQSSDLEQVRAWRNDPFVRQKMFFQEEITAEDQATWFGQLDSSSQYYIIHFEETAIGVINVKNIDWEQRIGEAGIFIGDARFRNSFVSMLAILCMMDVYFELFEFSKLTATLRSDNEAARIFNLELGYEIESEDGERICLEISAQAYRTKMLERRAGLLPFDKIPLKTVFTDEERHLFFRK